MLEVGTRVELSDLKDFGFRECEGLTGATGTVIEPEFKFAHYNRVKLDTPFKREGSHTMTVVLMRDDEVTVIGEPKVVWMLDYLHAVFPQWGVFESEEAAWEWVDTYNSELPRTSFTPFSLVVNTDNSKIVETTCPEKRYANQR